MPPATAVSPSDFALLCRVIQAVARSSRLPPDDADDFAQTAHLKLLERNYAPLAAFSGRSSLRTYLTAVVHRLLLDWRNGRYGKWRPSAEARRLGSAGVALDRLISRDGHSVDEAVAILSGRPASPPAAALEALAARIPARRRIRIVPDDDLVDLAMVDFVDPVAAADAAAAQRHARRRLRLACEQLGADDRRLLHLRFGRNLSVVAIAELLDTPPKPLYRRIARLVAMIRRALAPATGAPTADGARHPENRLGCVMGETAHDR